MLTEVTTPRRWIQLIALTKAIAVVIMLPPDPPITRVLSPDPDFSIAGAMEEGGCSPEDIIKSENLISDRKSVV